MKIAILISFQESIDTILESEESTIMPVCLPLEHNKSDSMSFYSRSGILAYLEFFDYPSIEREQVHNP